MEIKEGANVVTANGDKVGSVDRVVIDPGTKQVTHLVVRKGLLFTEDKVLPLEYVERSEGDTVYTRQEAGSLDHLPDYLEREFIQLDESELADLETRPPAYVSPVYWYPAFGQTWATGAGGPYTPAIQVPSTIERNIPEDTVPLKEGSNVISSDGKHIGDLERILVAPGSDRATHFIISQGLLFKERKVVPVTWVRQIAEDKIILEVGSRFVEHLPQYEEDPK
jgi:uncharacterized protein YrrD